MMVMDGDEHGGAPGDGEGGDEGGGVAVFVAQLQV